MGELRWPAAVIGRVLGMMACAVVAASCTSDGDIGVAAGQAQPASASYRCEDGASLRIQNRRTSVTVTLGDAAAIDLPASPPGSRSRYGEPPYALVLDDREALFFQTGHSPLACRR